MTITRYKLNGTKELRMLIIADLHGNWSDDFLYYVRQENPDFILIPGDLYTPGNSGNPFSKEKDFSELLLLLKELASISTVLYSFGNHEIRRDEEYIKAVESCGIKILDNKWISDCGLVFGGLSSVSDTGIRRRFNKHKDLKLEWLKDKPEGFSVLLSHHPEHYDLIENSADLIVSGHAHGGQWRILGRGLYAPDQGILPRYTKGQYGKMIVSAGASNSVIVPRLFNPTELVVIDLTKD